MSGKQAAIAQLREILDTLEVDQLDATPANDEGDAPTLARLLEQRCAELESVRGDLKVVLARLDKLEAMITRQGGHMSPEDQAELRDARTVLEHHGIRVVARPVWRDR